MNLKMLPFVNVLQTLQLPIQSRQRAAAIAIGYAAACHIPLPSSEVADAEDYFRSNSQATVRSVVSLFNEGVVIETNLAQEFARNFWLMRYEAVHRCPRMDQIPGSFFCSVFGVARFFSPKAQAFCDENAKSINAIYQVVCGLVTDMVQEANDPNKQSDRAIEPSY